MILSPEQLVIKYRPRGSMQQIFYCKEPEVLLEGPAGTGKSRGALELCHLRLLKYPNARGIMVRRTRTSMTETCMYTYERFVLHSSDGVQWTPTDQKYIYPNGSEFIVCGLDKPVKLMSSEYDFCYAQEATELDLGQWELINTRLRNGAMPYQQILADCNPDDPRHWLHLRSLRGLLTSFPTKHEDNPVLYDDINNCWTDRGKQYLAKLDNLTGVRYLRLRKGLWAAAEGVVYEEWDRTLHVVDSFKPPEDWPHYWSVDFGFRDPFVWQHWRTDEDHRLYLQEEIYCTERLVEDHCERIKKLWLDKHGVPKYMPRAIICDHDAEGRATMEKHLMVLTLPAYKAIADGIQGVKARLKKQKDGKPRIMMMRDALVETDPLLVDAAKPYSTEQEVTSYVWRLTPGRNDHEEPEDKNNHGMDAKRYMVGYIDDLAIDPQDEETLVTFEDRVHISSF